MNKEQPPSRPRERDCSDTTPGGLANPLCHNLREKIKEEIMSRLERIQRYIERTNVPAIQRVRYDIGLEDVRVIGEQDIWSAICTAYNYGLSRGWRAAKREAGR